MAIGAAPDGILNRRVQEDKVSWYRKRNLRLLYLLMLPTCLGVEISAGCVLYSATPDANQPYEDAHRGVRSIGTVGL